MSKDAKDTKKDSKEDSTRGELVYFPGSLDQAVHDIPEHGTTEQYREIATQNRDLADQYKQRLQEARADLAGAKHYRFSAATMTIIAGVLAIYGFYVTQKYISQIQSDAQKNVQGIEAKIDH